MSVLCLQVAALATLAILRVLASGPLSKELDEVQVKCITFSQPPVGNAALKEYVYFKVVQLLAIEEILLCFVMFSIMWSCVSQLLSCFQIYLYFY